MNLGAGQPAIPPEEFFLAMNCAVKDAFASLQSELQNVIHDAFEQLRLTTPTLATSHRRLEHSSTPISHPEIEIVHSHLWKARCKQVALKSTAVTGGVKKRHRSRPGSIGSLATCKHPKRKVSFQRLVAEIAQDVKTDWRFQTLVVPSLLGSTVSVQSNLASNFPVSGTGTSIHNLSFLNASCDYVFVAKLGGIDAKNEEGEYYNKKAKVNCGDVKELGELEGVSVKGNVQVPILGEKGRGRHALQLLDEMPKSKGLCSVGKTVTSIRDKGGGLEHGSWVTYEEEDEYFVKYVEKDDQADHRIVESKKELVETKNEAKKKGVLQEMFEGLCKVVKAVLVDRVENVGVSDCVVNCASCLRTDKYGCTVDKERAPALRGTNMVDYMLSKTTMEVSADCVLDNVNSLPTWCKKELREKAISVVSSYPRGDGAVLNGNKNLILHFLTNSGDSFKLTFSLVISLIELWKYGYVEQNMIWFTKISVTSSGKDCLKHYYDQRLIFTGVKLETLSADRFDKMEGDATVMIDDYNSKVETRGYCHLLMLAQPRHGMLLKNDDSVAVLEGLGYKSCDGDHEKAAKYAPSCHQECGEFWLKFESLNEVARCCTYETSLKNVNQMILLLVGVLSCRGDTMQEESMLAFGVDACLFDFNFVTTLEDRPEAAVTTDFISNHDREVDFHDDTIVRYDNLNAIERADGEVSKRNGLSMIRLHVATLFFGMILKALGPHQYYDIDGDYISEKVSLLSHPLPYAVGGIDNYLLVAGDLYRPTAIVQIAVLSEHVGMIILEDYLWTISHQQTDSILSGVDIVGTCAIIISALVLMGTCAQLFSYCKSRIMKHLMQWAQVVDINSQMVIMYYPVSLPQENRWENWNLKGYAEMAREEKVSLFLDEKYEKMEGSAGMTYNYIWGKWKSVVMAAYKHHSKELHVGYHIIEMSNTGGNIHVPKFDSFASHFGITTFFASVLQQYGYEIRVESFSAYFPSNRYDTSTSIITVAQAVGSVLCWKCGIPMASNAVNRCFKCLQCEVDLAKGLQKQATIVHCLECDIYLQPLRTGIKTPLESNELPAFWVKRLKNLNKFSTSGDIFRPAVKDQVSILGVREWMITSGDDKLTCKWLLELIVSGMIFLLCRLIDWQRCEGYHMLLQGAALKLYLSLCQLLDLSMLVLVSVSHT